MMFQQIEHDEADQLRKNDNLVIADVRDFESYQIEHIPESVHLSMQLLKEFCAQTDKTQPVLVYCNHGISSRSVAQHLVDHGFTEVYSLVGGFEVWREHHPTSDTSNK